MAIARLGKLSFEFEEEVLECENLPEISQDDAKEILFKTQDVFSQVGVEVYLAYGTLLGAVRDQAIIPGDLDVDVYIKDEMKMFQHLQKIEECGLKLIRALNNTYSFRLNNTPNCFIDVYIMKPTMTIWGLYCYNLEIMMVPKNICRMVKWNFWAANSSAPGILRISCVSGMVIHGISLSANLRRHIPMMFRHIIIMPNIFWHQRLPCAVCLATGFMMP